MQEPNVKENHSQFFVAIVFKGAAGDAVMKIKHEFAEKYNSKKPLNSPPHITLIKPFYFKDSQIETIENPLREFSLNQKSFSVQLAGFNAFKPKTIFVDVLPNEKLFHLYDELCLFIKDNLETLIDYLPEEFTPHVTMGNRDLTKGNFKKAWEVFEHQKFETEFEVNSLTLLRHNSTHWETFCDLPFSTSIS